MEDKYFVENNDSEYGEGVLLDEYHGNWSLVSARKGGDGEIYMQWCYPQDKDRKPRNKSIPWKINFGSKPNAEAILRYLLKTLGNESPPNKDPF